jgi:hypothetical protein
MDQEHASAERKPALAGKPTAAGPDTVQAPTSPVMRPVAVAGLLAAHTDRSQSERRGGQVRRTRVANSTVGGVLRRSKADYTQGYDEGYLYNARHGEAQGFLSGFLDGIEELVQARLIVKQVAKDIVRNHPRTIQYPTGWDADFDASLSAFDHREDGRAAGYGFGFDQGYEEALARYGYARKYSAIPPVNTQAATNDNGGICVYCNASAIADIDHVYPLKEHWKARGAIMDQLTRSNEANHLNNLVGACANCNRSKGSKLLRAGWNPPAWGALWWPFGPNRAQVHNDPPPYW